MNSEKPEINYEDHWDRVYRNSRVESLGWYEKSSDPSLSLIKKCALTKSDPILVAGAGATTLIDSLLSEGYENIIANDLSTVALGELKKRIGDDSSGKIKWIADDLTNPRKLNKLSDIALWHDRAVLHFFLKDDEQAAYFDLVKKIVRPGGYVIIAAFNLNGAAKCSGLPVHRYNEKMIKDRLGKDFIILNAFNNTYIMPSGETREYIYTLFQKI